MKTADKTNAIRKLDSMKIQYKEYHYGNGEAVSATEVAEILGRDPASVFKTLVTVGKTGEHFVFMLPAAGELDLKKAAETVGEKSIEMVKSKELLPLTGYIHGGCSPIGMRKNFRTTLDDSALSCETILFSGGRIGCQIELSIDELKRVIDLGFGKLCR